MAGLDNARSSPPDASAPITRRRLPSRTWTSAPWRRQARPAANLKPAPCRVALCRPAAEGSGLTRAYLARLDSWHGRWRPAERCTYHLQLHGSRSCASAAHSPPAAAHSPGRCLEQLGRVLVIQPCPAGHGVEVTGRQPPRRPRAILEHPTPRLPSRPRHRNIARSPLWRVGRGPGNRPGHPTRPGVSPVPICRAAVHSRGRDWCPGWPNPRCSRYPAVHHCSWRWEKMSI
jgi:hypothetical protein